MARRSLSEGILLAKAAAPHGTEMNGVAAAKRDHAHARRVLMGTFKGDKEGANLKE
jgi:hypothetical protein